LILLLRFFDSITKTNMAVIALTLSTVGLKL